MPAHFAPPEDLPTLFELLERLPIGVILLDHGGRVRLYNAAEERFARRRREDVLGRAFFEEIAPCFEKTGLAQEFRQRIGREEFSVERAASFALPFRDSPREVRLKMISIRSGDHPFACILLEDVTAWRAMERLKENLAALLVHDMKSPLTVMLGNLSLLELQLGQEREIGRRSLRDARSAAERLHRMVLGLLDIARIEEGKVPLRLEAFDLRALAVTASCDLAGVATSHEVSLVWKGDERATEIVADSDLVRRALDNLLDNAMRFAPGGSQIEVSIDHLPERARVALCVRDHGPGIPEEERAQVFDKFMQAEPGPRPGNFGLGLTFVRLAARAHGGEATVTCPSNGGCLFRVELPLPP